MSNVMARYVVDKLDSVETIRIRDGWMDFTKGVPPWLAVTGVVGCISTVAVVAKKRR